MATPKHHCKRCLSPSYLGDPVLILIIALFTLSFLAIFVESAQFREIDLNNDGFLSVSELQAYFQRRGDFDPRSIVALVDDMMANQDYNGDGFLGPDEWHYRRVSRDISQPRSPGRHPNPTWRGNNRRNTGNFRAGGTGIGTGVGIKNNDPLREHLNRFSSGANSGTGSTMDNGIISDLIRSHDSSSSGGFSSSLDMNSFNSDTALFVENDKIGDKNHENDKIDDKNHENHRIEETPTPNHHTRDDKHVGHDDDDDGNDNDGFDEDNHHHRDENHNDSTSFDEERHDINAIDHNDDHGHQLNADGELIRKTNGNIDDPGDTEGGNSRNDSNDDLIITVCLVTDDTPHQHSNDTGTATATDTATDTDGDGKKKDSKVVGTENEHHDDGRFFNLWRLLQFTFPWSQSPPVVMVEHDDPDEIAAINAIDGHQLDDKNHKNDKKVDKNDKKADKNNKNDKKASKTVKNNDKNTNHTTIINYCDQTNSADPSQHTLLDVVVTDFILGIDYIPATDALEENKAAVNTTTDTALEENKAKKSETNKSAVNATDLADMNSDASSTNDKKNDDTSKKNNDKKNDDASKKKHDDDDGDDDDDEDSDSEKKTDIENPPDVMKPKPPVFHTLSRSVFHTFKTPFHDLSVADDDGDGLQNHGNDVSDDNNGRPDQKINNNGNNNEIIASDHDEFQNNNNNDGIPDEPQNYHHYLEKKRGGRDPSFNTLRNPSRSTDDNEHLEDNSNDDVNIVDDEMDDTNMIHRPTSTTYPSHRNTPRRNTIESDANGRLYRYRDDGSTVYHDNNRPKKSRHSHLHNYQSDTPHGYSHRYRDNDDDDEKDNSSETSLHTRKNHPHPRPRPSLHTPHRQPKTLPFFPEGPGPVIPKSNDLHIGRRPESYRSYPESGDNDSHFRPITHRNNDSASSSSTSSSSAPASDRMMKPPRSSTHEHRDDNNEKLNTLCMHHEPASNNTSSGVNTNNPNEKNPNIDMAPVDSGELIRRFENSLRRNHPRRVPASSSSVHDSLSFDNNITGIEPARILPRFSTVGTSESLQNEENSDPTSGNPPLPDDDKIHKRPTDHN